jgi:hypothetical protein
VADATIRKGNIISSSAANNIARVTVQVLAPRVVIG